MTDSGQSPIRLELELSPDQADLLVGLDHWLNLGLISEAQVLALGRDRLSCAWSPVTATDEPIAATPPGNPFVEPPALSAREGFPDFLPPPGEAEPKAVPGNRRHVQPSSAAGTSPQPGSRMRQPAPTRRTRSAADPLQTWINRLMNELSVVWLLGLGVFLVVLSSAVLAAAQWTRFSAVGQYLVLLAYTLVFWAMGQWSRSQANLRLTAKTLQIATLLLVPLNFWAIDGLGLMGTTTSIFVALVAALALSLATVQILRHQGGQWQAMLNLLLLAYLHLGWGWEGMPVLAAYGGTLVSAAGVWGRLGSPSNRTSDLEAGQGTEAISRPTAPPNHEHRSSPLSLVQLVIGFALGLLLVRVLTVLPPTQWGQVGLAFGLYGATWVWRGQTLTDPPSAPATGEPPDSPSSGSTALFDWSVLLGRGLLWGGWLMAISDWLAQAFGVSALGLGLRLRQLQRQGRRQDLWFAFAISVQLGIVAWALLPEPLSRSLTQPLAAWFNTTSDPDLLLGLSLYPYVVGLVVVADRYARRQQPVLVQFSESLAIGFNGLLTLISSFNGSILAVNLIASTLTALLGTLYRQPQRQWRILTCYGLGLAAIFTTIDAQYPDLPLSSWMGIVFSLAIAALLLSRGLPALWGRGAWFYGLGLSGLAYVLLGHHLIETDLTSKLSWLGLTIPLTLTAIGQHRLSLLTTGLTAPLALGLPWTRLVGLGTATGLTVLNSRYLRTLPMAVMALGFGLGFVISLVDGLPAYPASAADWGLVTMLLILGFWTLWRGLTILLQTDAAGEQLPISVYRQASDIWGHLLMVGLLLYLTGALSFCYVGIGASSQVWMVTLAGLLLILIGRYWGQPRPVTVYLAGWATELLLAAAIVGHAGTTPLTLAVPTLGLGGLSLGLRWRWPNLQPALQHLSLGYAVLALLLRTPEFTAWTGWVVVGVSLLGLEVGRQNRWSGLRWLALGGLSWGWFELVLYQLTQSNGGSTADGLVILAAVATLIMAVYRLSAGWLDRRLHLPDRELIGAAHLHWAVAVILLLLTGAMLDFQPYSLAALALGLGLGLVVYALAQGRLPERLGRQSLWIYLGLLTLVGWFTLARLSFTGLARLDHWWGAVACAVALIVYWLPWDRGGWPLAPFRMMAVGVPLAITVLTLGFDHIPTLWVLVGFYAGLAWTRRQIQLSYLAVGIAVWAIWAWLEQQAIDDSLLFVAPLSLALLYLAQVEPELKSPENKASRHWLRLLATSIMLLVALISDRWTGLPVAGMGLAVIAAGLLLRTRAYLFAGTVIFGLNAFNQLILLNATYPFIKWVLGIMVGVGLIWIAADFERRREQWLNLTQTWSQDFDRWQ